MKEPLLKLSREKHLDHMVRVVPLIVMAFAIQCYILSQMETALGSSTFIVLGVCLSMMILGFITYDLQHKVEFFDDYMVVEFLGMHNKIFYSEISKIDVEESHHTFGSIKFFHKHGSNKCYFVDDVDKLKSFIEEKQKVVSQAA